MELNTRLFGTIDYTEEDVISFPNGIPSFEDEHEFLLLPIAGGEEALLCMQSVTTPHLSFILMNPFSLDQSYAPVLKESERSALQVERDQELCFHVLCAMKRPLPDSTINLKCPIAVNLDKRIAMQIILDTDEYHMRHPLSQFVPKEAAPC